MNSTILWGHFKLFIQNFDHWIVSVTKMVNSREICVIFEILRKSDWWSCKKISREVCEIIPNINKKQDYKRMLQVARSFATETSDLLNST